MAEQEESREDWEKEFVDVQRHFTFSDGLRSSQIIAKKLSATPTPIPDFAHLVRLLLSGVLLIGAFLIFSSKIQHNTVLGLAFLAASCFLGISSFRSSHKPR